MDTILNLDIPKGHGAKYAALADGIRAAVLDGTLAAETKMPTVRNLAFQLSITPGTVARAYSCLVEEGVLKAQVGRGTFVAGKKSKAKQSGPLDLSRPGVPDVGQVAMIRKAYLQLAEGDEDDFLHYPDRAAGRPAREGFLNDLAGVDLGDVSAEEIVLSHGAQHAFIIALQCILKGPAPVVAAEALAYPGFRHAVRVMRAETAGIDSDEEGPLPDALVELCKSNKIQAFVTSAHAHNPTTVQTSAMRRAQIIALARQYDFQIVEDECYGRTASDMTTYRALAPERVWYLGSISKSFSAAFRVGYLIPPKSRFAEVLQISRHNSFGISRPVAEVVGRLLNSPEWPRVRAAVDAAYTKRVRILAEYLAEFSLAWRENVPFAFLRLPLGWRISSFVRAAEDRGVLVRAADDFVLIDGRAPNAVRISINACVSLEEFIKGVKILRDLLSSPPHEMDA